MSLLWVKVAAYEDAQPEARERRMDRVKKWVDRKDNAYGEFAIPDHFGPFTPAHQVHDKVMSSHWFSQGHLMGNVHSHHLPWQEVPLDGNLHTTQEMVMPHHLRPKIDANREDDDGPTDDIGGDEHDPTSDPIVFKHRGVNYLLDGHHRFVEHRLMGKKTMGARVFDADDPKSGPEHCYDCQEHKEYCSDCGGTPDWERD